MEEVNPEVLKGARRARKLSLNEVATYTKISENSLRKFENNEAQPSYKQLSKLGGLYNLQPYSFFEAQTPHLQETLPDFRKTRPTAANLSPKGLTRLWQVGNQATFIDDLVEALGRDAPDLLPLHRVTNRRVPSASELRVAFESWLGDRSSKLRFSGNNTENFHRHLRLFLDSHGCFTVSNDAPIEDYLGFYKKFAKNYRAIFVNRALKHDKRKLFTLAHEMAHFLHGEEGLSDPFILKNDIEKVCNTYAAKFLAPDETIFRVLDDRAAPSAVDATRLINFVSRNTLLSRQASALRLRELDVLSRASVTEFFAYVSRLKRDIEPENEPKSQGAMGAAAAAGKKLGEVGVYGAYVASVALRQRLVDVVDVERGLGISETLQPRVLSMAEKRFEASVG